MYDMYSIAKKQFIKKNFQKGKSPIFLYRYNL